MAAETLVRIPLVRRFPNGTPIVVGIFLATAIAALDLVTGPAVSLGLLYVLVVMTVTWLGTRRHGFLVAGLAASESLLAAAWGDHALQPVDVWNAGTRLIVLVLVASLLNALRRALADHRRHATVDDLTGAMNRRAFALIAERERLRAGREGSPISLAYFDLDHLKRVNDAYGHDAGDAFLTAFSHAVDGSVRATDCFARMGGDEFALLLPETDAREAMVVVDRVRTLLARTTPDVPVTASVGLATFRFPPTTVDDMVACADDLMYRAKASGRDTVVGSVVAGPWSRWSQTMAANEPTLL